MSSQPTAKPARSFATRYLFLFLLGLVVGGVGAVMGLRALQARSDPFPDALMNVLAHQAGKLGEAAKANRCTVNDTLPRLHARGCVGPCPQDIGPGQHSWPGVFADRERLARPSGSCVH